MKNRAIELFYAVAGLGLILAILSAIQSAGTVTSRLSYALQPWLAAGFWSLVIVLALVLIGAVALLVYRLKIGHAEKRIELARAAGETVKFYSDGIQTWAANPLGLSLANLSQDWRLSIDPTEAEPMPDQWQVVRAIEFLRHRQPGRAIKQVDVPMLPEPTIQPVLPLILPSQRVLVAGGQGSGKTNLLLWLAYEKAKASKVLVIDTHAGPAYWPINPTDVLGRGRNWGAVEKALARLLAVMDQRYQDIAAGTVGIRGHEIITVIADEWTMIPEAIGQEAVKQYTKPVLTESRKAGIDFILAAHDTTTEALGTKGMHGLIKAFDWLVETECQNGQYICKVRKPSQKPSEAVIYAAPPVFNMPAQRQLSAGSVATDAPPMTFTVAPEPEPVEVDRPSAEDEAVMVAYFSVMQENGGQVVWSKVCERLGKTKGGKQIDTIKAVLSRWGVKYE